MPTASSSEARPWRVDDKGILVVTVRLTPRGGRDALDGIAVLSDGRAVIKARVRVAAEDGAANAALIAMLAKAAGVPASAASLKSGHRMRLKTIALAGNATDITGRLTEMLGRLSQTGDRGESQ
ncbi:DUF167 family protein [Chelatococcus asaccharovorans]|uniref:UPF0235 protein C7450_101727 n=1 Tax=Chelatococcus asaccharovorans TaxID=28210 RepID=A0A2V3UIG6_9HYPH|nr:DUF167 family protein [Chelatococcus asaccharovorans]MBS7706392.1 DUF167 domain-containing protein [Chelatococcus asaccharovorans]PXW64966.1 hypothetical protein C7450_101727 [Chelatococcus asaccharovorans]